MFRVTICVALFLTTLLGGAVAYAHLSSPMPRLAFDLINQNGQLITADDFKGHPLLIFFGFTGCSAICPTTLTRIHSLVEQNTNLRGLLITTDPYNDTPDTLRNYLSAFSPLITGLTGSPHSLNAVYADFRVWPGNEGRGDHSGFIYLVDARGHPRAHYTLQMSEEEMTKSIQKVLTETEANHE